MSLMEIAASCGCDQFPPTYQFAFVSIVAILLLYNACFSFSHCTTFSGTLMVERRLWRTNAQSSNRWLSLISRRVTGCARRRTKAMSTTQLLGSLGSGRG